MKPPKLTDLPPVLGRIPRITKRFFNQKPQELGHKSQKNRMQPGIKARGFVDDAIQTSKSGMLLWGWFVHTDTGIREVALVNSERRHILTPYRPIVMNRPDVKNALQPDFELSNDNHGFLIYAPISGLTKGEASWELEFVLDSGGVVRIPFNLRPSSGAMAGIQLVLSMITPEHPDLAGVFADTVGPCLEGIWAERQSQEVHATCIQFGTSIERPTVSVIVPLYGRVDFLRFQMASFSNDSEFAGNNRITELIYVLDDPRLEPELRALARLVYTTYQIPFRVVVLDRNTGFSGANNAGARFANGDYLLLLNSDVIPKQPGWLSQLVDKHKSLPDCGAVGCRLLFEDGSIQHAGMTFQRSDHVAGGWTNVHPLKGYPVAFDEAKVPIETPAVTAACLLVRRSLYDSVDGLSEDYILADFEDSDFCLKLRAQGLKIWYVPTVELFHLERQSFRKMNDAEWRQMVTLYNMWKHGQRWDAIINDLMTSEEMTERRKLRQAAT